MSVEQRHCTVCGFTTNSTKPGYVERSLRLHACEKRQARQARQAARAERPVRECTHKRHHPHGTQSRYNHDGCRCEACTAAVRWSNNSSRLARLNGAPKTVPADESRRLIASLRAKGMSLELIGQAAGLRYMTVRRIAAGAQDRTYASTEAKLRRVRPAIHPGHRINPVGVQRRLQALARVGWSIGALAAASGMNREMVFRLRAGKAGCTVATALRVRRLYDDLWDQRPPTETRGQNSGVARTIADAKRRGWPPPLAWDDIDHDPAPADVTPDRDSVMADIEWLADTGVDLERAATRLGMHPESIDRRARRAGRHDLTDRLRANGRTAA